MIEKFDTDEISPRRGREENLYFVAALVGSLRGVGAVLETEKRRKVRRMPLSHMRPFQRGVNEDANRKIRDKLPGISGS